GRPGAPAGLAPGFRVPLAGLGVGAAATTVALVAYLVAVARLALDYEKDAWVVQGGWVGVRLVGLATLVAAALLLNRAAEVRAARRAAAERADASVAVVAETRALRVARGVSTRVMLGCVVAGSTILLVVLACWGVYRLGICPRRDAPGRPTAGPADSRPCVARRPCRAYRGRVRRRRLAQDRAARAGHATHEPTTDGADAPASPTSFVSFELLPPELRSEARFD